MISKAEIRSEKLFLASKFTRSPEWPKVKRLFLKQHPDCAVCGVSTGATVHHKKPYWLFPSLELDPTNLITLCEYVANHHLFIGHLMNYMSFNENVVEDSAIWNARISTRPKWK
jgi:hypothetical protein